MPNWCYNNVTLHHEDPEMIQRAVSGFKASKLLHEFIPCHQDLHDAVAGFTDDKKKQKLAEKNLKKHGYQNWYDFATTEWGTKWDVGSEHDEPLVTDDGHTVELSFDSAWGPPIAAYEKWESEHGFTVVAYYHEEGMNFCGKWVDGDDHYYEIPGSADGIRAEIPDDIDTMFSLSERAEEEENDEAWEPDFSDGDDDETLEEDATDQGETQLDRIEGKLDQLLEHNSKIDDLEAALEELKAEFDRLTLEQLEQGKDSSLD